jgi:DNA primase
VTWDEVERGVEIDDFRIDNLPGRVRDRGDLFAAIANERGRASIEKLVPAVIEGDYPRVHRPKRPR